jgi:predicted RNase H-like nuclease (RuvC/YqgF family)
MSARAELADRELSDIRNAFRPLIAAKDEEIKTLTELVQRERERADKLETELETLRGNRRVVSLRR